MVRIPCKSVPAPGSVRPIPERRFPVANSGRYFFFCSSVPYLLIIQHESEWLPRIPAIAIHPRANSSKTSEKETISSPRPPNSSGMVIPKRPISFICSTISVGYRPVRSHSPATGLISFSTKSRSSDRNALCSSLNVKSISYLSWL